MSDTVSAVSADGNYLITQRPGAVCPSHPDATPWPQFDYLRLPGDSGGPVVDMASLRALLTRGLGKTPASQS